MGGIVPCATGIQALVEVGQRLGHGKGYQYDPDTANKLQKPNVVNGLFRDIVDSPRLSGTRRDLSRPARYRAIVDTAVDAIGAFPPIAESHVEMDGAWALFEAWHRLMHGDIETAFVIGPFLVGILAALIAPWAPIAIAASGLASERPRIGSSGRRVPKWRSSSMRPPRQTNRAELGVAAA